MSPVIENERRDDIRLFDLAASGPPDGSSCCDRTGDRLGPPTSRRCSAGRTPRCPPLTSCRSGGASPAIRADTCRRSLGESHAGPRLAGGFLSPRTQSPVCAWTCSGRLRAPSCSTASRWPPREAERIGELELSAEPHPHRAADRLQGRPDATSGAGRDAEGCRPMSVARRARDLIYAADEPGSRFPALGGGTI